MTTPTDKVRAALETSTAELMRILSDSLRFSDDGGHAPSPLGDAIKANKDALSELDGIGWQPIETAPKDGRVFLVMLPRMMNLVVRSRYNTLYKHFTDEVNSDDGLTKGAFYHDGDLWCDILPPPMIAPYVKGE